MNLKNFLIQTLITGLAVLIGAYLLGGIHVDGYGSALLVALALALLNQFVKPLLVILTIPATILTLGLFLLVINAVVILLADWMVLGFSVDGFWWALFFSFILSITKSFLNMIFGQDVNKKQRIDKD
jgi:putative membrane protein